MIVIALVFTAMLVRADSLIVNPSHLNLTVPVGRLDSCQIKITNSGETHLKVRSDYNPEWMLVYPPEFEISQGIEKEVLAIFFFPDGLAPEKGEIVFQADGETAKVEVEVSQIEDIEKTPISKEMIEVKKMKREVAELRNKITKLEPYQAIVEDYKKQVKVLRDKVHNLQAAEEANRKELEALHDILIKELAEDISADAVQVSWSNEKLLIIIPSLFDSGQFYPDEQDSALLEKIGHILKSYAGDNLIEIRGHADILPISETMKDKVASNWELSAIRASTIARIFQHRIGIKGKNLIVSGCSMYRPMYDNRTIEGMGKNRRVEIFVLVP